ncbi:MAG: hypothetical protein ACRDTR_15075 [Rubrobacter sp.]
MERQGSRKPPRETRGGLVAAGCDRIVFNVAAPDEAAGAGRFYRRLGWDLFVREIVSEVPEA